MSMENKRPMPVIVRSDPWSVYRDNFLNVVNDGANWKPSARLQNDYLDKYNVTVKNVYDMKASPVRFNFNIDKIC